MQECGNPIKKFAFIGQNEVHITSYSIGDVPGNYKMSNPPQPDLGQIVQVNKICYLGPHAIGRVVEFCSQGTEQDLSPERGVMPHLKMDRQRLIVNPAFPADKEFDVEAVYGLELVTEDA